MNNYKKQKGFTLVELLVVISIIALLLAILMPSLQKVRAQAKKVVCSSRLHQFGLFCQVYAADWENYFPAQGYARFGNEARATIGNMRYSQARAFYEQNKEFCTITQCPNLKENNSLITQIIKTTNGFNGYVSMGYFYLGGIYNTPTVNIPYLGTRALNNPSGIYSDGKFPASPIRGSDKSGMYLAADKMTVYDEATDPFASSGIPLVPGDKRCLAMSVGHLSQGGGVTQYGYDGSGWTIHGWRVMRVNNLAGSNHLYADGHIEWKNFNELVLRAGDGLWWAPDEVGRR